MSQAIGEFGISWDAIKGWQRTGRVRQGIDNSVHRQDLARTIADLRGRPCKKCGKPVESIRTGASFCPNHRFDRTMPRRTWTEKHRTKHMAAVRRWRQEHPINFKVMQQRARMVWVLVWKKGVNRDVARRRAAKRYPLPKAAKTEGQGDRRRGWNLRQSKDGRG